MNSKIQQNRSVASLDAQTALRFFAALAVVFFHVPFVLPESVGKDVILGDGALGVSFFFVLSGFILKHVSGREEVDWLHFYRRRMARVLPMHYLTLTVWTLMFFSGWGNPLQDKLNSGVANVFVIHSFFNGPLFNLGFNAVSWSISVELFFYAIFPWLYQEKRAVFIVLAYAILFATIPKSLSNGINAAWPSFFYLNPLSRLFEFSGGIALYQFYTACKPDRTIASCLQALSIFLLLGSIYATNGNDTHHRNLLLLLPFGLVIVSFAWEGIFQKAISTKPLILLGEASFSLYMIHHMLFRVLDPIFERQAFPPTLALFLAVTASIIFSIALFYLFERPVRLYISTGRFPTQIIKLKT
jgi:peptidoglycan/LPS O-acetylase OafA/YrhL